MTLAYWFSKRSRAVFQFNAPLSARVICRCCMSAANGNGWFAKLAAMLPKVLPVPLSMRNGKRNPWRSSSVEPVFILDYQQAHTLLSAQLSPIGARPV
jgi:hypothetical protein